jgi:hypothetical protein
VGADPDSEVSTVSIIIAFKRRFGEKLGLDVDYTNNNYLTVDAVTAGGAVERYNQSRSCYYRIKPRDRIVEINNISKQSSLMIDELKSEQYLRFIIEREIIIGDRIACMYK